MDVVIPYVDLLNFPTQWVQCRRYQAQFYGLIEAYAMLRQRQKAVKTTADGKRYIEADAEDYRAAFEVALHCLMDNLSVITPQARTLNGHILALVGDKPARECLFTREELAAATGWSMSWIKRHLPILIANEIVALDHREQAGRHVYRLLVTDLSEFGLSGLLAPEELVEMLPKETRIESPAAASFPRIEMANHDTKSAKPEAISA